MRIVRKALFGILSTVILVLAGTNLLVYQVYLKTRTQSDRMHTLLKEAPENFKQQAMTYVHAVKRSAAEAFTEVLNNMRLFGDLSEEGEREIKALLEKRQRHLREFNQNQTNPLRDATRVIELDHQILAVYADMAKMQSMHREKIIGKLEPLAGAVGVKE